MKRASPEMRTPFDPRLTQRLIEAVKASPALYDPTHADARDLAVKAELWTNITLQLGYESGDEQIIKTRWKNMRDSFLKYKKVNCGLDGITKNYKNWPWAPYMDFLDCQYERIASGSAQRARLRDRSASRASAASGSGGGRHSEHGDELEEAEEADVKPTLRRRRQRRRERRLDSVDLLFQSYAQTMKGFGAKRRALLKMRLSNMFAQAEIEELEEGGGGDPLVGRPGEAETDSME